MKATYQLTPLGLLGQETLDRMLLFFVRAKFNALIWTGDKFVFSEVKLEPKHKTVAKPKSNGKA